MGGPRITSGSLNAKFKEIESVTSQMVFESTLQSVEYEYFGTGSETIDES